MEKSKNKYFAPINIFNALKEAEEKYFVIPDEKEINDFFSFWSDAYDLWLSTIKTKINQPKIEHKIEMRKMLLKLKL